MSNIVWSRTKGWHDGPKVKPVVIVRPDPERARLFARIHAASVKVTS